MDFSFVFFFNSILLGVGLAMDAFSVSLANGLNEPCMKPKKVLFVAGIFAFFQGLMPLLGWICVHTVVEYFHSFGTYIPWIALILLSFIGGKMLWEGLHNHCECEEKPSITIATLLVQGVATSIDALSVGFTISDHNLPMAIVCSGIIAVVTFCICVAGLYIGKKAGTKLSGKAGILGGSILIIIGLEIFISSFF